MVGGNEVVVKRVYEVEEVGRVVRILLVGGEGIEVGDFIGVDGGGGGVMV